MNAKLSNFSELSNILSVKSSLRTNLLSLFTRFGLGHLLCRMSLEKQAGIPAVQLILSLCLFRIAGESIHSMHRKSYYGLLDTGHNCYYRMMRRATMDWRRLLLGMALRFLAILRKEHAEVSSDNASYIFQVRVKAPYLQGFAGCYICKCRVFLGVGNFSNIMKFILFCTIFNHC